MKLQLQELKLQTVRQKVKSYIINSEKKQKTITIIFYIFFSKTETGFHKMVITHAFNKNT